MQMATIPTATQVQMGIDADRVAGPVDRELLSEAAVERVIPDVPF
jgi:hypothetical protein